MHTYVEAQAKEYAVINKIIPTKVLNADYCFVFQR